MAIFGMTHSALSAKQASLLGCGVTKGFQDYFGDGGTANALKSAYWNESSNGVSPGVLTIQNATDDLPVYCELDSGADDEDWIQADSFNKYMLSPYEADVSAVHFKTRARFTVIDGANCYAYLGLADAGALSDSALIYIAYGTYYYNSRGAASESTDASGDIVQNTWYTIEIIWSAAAVKYYVDNDLKATHTTAANLPNEPMATYIYARNNGTQTNTEVQYVQFWAE